MARTSARRGSKNSPQTDVLVSFLVLTGVFHTLLAALVFAHTRQRGQSERTWVVLTLLFGLGGVAGYLWGLA